jgi:hypothetical protein
MSKTGEQGKVTPPSLDKDGNLLVDENASIAETSTTPTVEKLIKKIEKLNSELSKLKAKDKKDKKNGFIFSWSPLFWPDGPCIQLESIRDAS